MRRGSRAAPIAQLTRPVPVLLDPLLGQPVVLSPRTEVHVLLDVHLVGFGLQLGSPSIGHHLLICHISKPWSWSRSAIAGSSWARPRVVSSLARRLRASVGSSSAAVSAAQHLRFGIRRRGRPGSPAPCGDSVSRNGKWHGFVSAKWQLLVCGGWMRHGSYVVLRRWSRGLSGAGGHQPPEPD